MSSSATRYSRHVASPGEPQRRRDHPRLAPGRAAGRERDHGPDARLDVRRGQRRPASEAVSDDPHAGGIEASVRPPGVAAEEMIEEKAHVGHAVRDQGLQPRRLLLRGLVLATRELRHEYLGVIRRGDDVAVAGEVSAEERGHAPGPAAVVREDDQRVRAGLGRGLAHRGLTARRGDARNGEDVLASGREVLARVCGRRGVPDLGGEDPIPLRITSLDGPHAHREPRHARTDRRDSPAGRIACRALLRLVVGAVLPYLRGFRPSNAADSPELRPAATRLRLVEVLWRPARARGRELLDPSRRGARPHRPQRRRQDHALRVPGRRDARDRGRAAPGRPRDRRTGAQVAPLLHARRDRALARPTPGLCARLHRPLLRRTR